MYYKDKMEELKGLFGEKVEIIKTNVGEIIIEVLDKKDIVKVMKILKDHTGLEYKGIVDITCVDYKDRMKMVYELLSIRNSMRIRVRSELRKEESVEIESISGVFKGADWLEREVYDMFGVYFINHKDLRRLLTDYGFKGNALKKDFKGGYEVKYDEEKKVVKAY